MHLCLPGAKNRASECDFDPTVVLVCDDEIEGHDFLNVEVDIDKSNIDRFLREKVALDGRPLDYFLKIMQEFYGDESESDSDSESD